MVPLSHLPTFPTYHDIPYYKKTNKTNKGNLYLYTYIRVWRGLNWRRLLWFSFTCLFLDFSLDFLCSINCMRFLFLNLGLFLFVKLFRYIYCLFLNKNINFCVLSYWLLFLNFTFMVVHLMYYATTTNSCTWPYILSMCYS